jgi:hypothetical protein
MARSKKYLTNVEKMTDRLTIDIFKRKVQQTVNDPRQLRGTWVEACDILQSHFGKLSRIMVQNEYKLHSLYRTAIKELGQV